jgi:L-lactate dehydrogenase complex protein LldG
MLDTFQARAEAVSAQVHRFAARPQALDFVVDVLGKEGVEDVPGHHAVWANGRLLDGIDRAALAARRPGIRFDVTREAAAGARVGVSEMDFAIAATGTLVQVATAVEQRLVSTLPLVHVAIAPARRIVPDLATLLRQVRPGEVGYLAFITGPSRTADIERVLTIGVHGPERLVIVLVDDL